MLDGDSRMNFVGVHSERRLDSLNGKVLTDGLQLQNGPQFTTQNKVRNDERAEGLLQLLNEINKNVSKRQISRIIDDWLYMVLTT